MATATITLQSICAGGGHVTLGVQVNGGQVRQFHFDSDEIREQIGVERLRDALLVLVRLHCMGMTRAQVRNELQAGIDVVTS